jgi:hypothetical protein
MFDTPQIPPIHLGWLAPEALAAEPYREVFGQTLRAHGWPKIMLDNSLTDRGWQGFANRLAWQETQSAAARLTLASHPVRTLGEIEGAFAAMARQHADGLLTCEDALIVAQRRRIVTLAAAHRLPAVYPLREFVEAGGLMAYGPNFTVLYRRAAAYVERESSDAEF